MHITALTTAHTTALIVILTTALIIALVWATARAWAQCEREVHRTP